MAELRDQDTEEEDGPDRELARLRARCDELEDRVARFEDRVARSEASEARMRMAMLAAASALQIGADAHDDT